MIEPTSATQIKIKITLINAIDEALILRELLSPKSLRCCEVEAILDPGLVYLMVPEKVARQLGLRSLDQPTNAPQTNGLSVTEALRIAWGNRVITEDALIGGDQVRLGRVVLEKLDLLISAREQLAGSTNEPTNLDPVQPDFSVDHQHLSL